MDLILWRHADAEEGSPDDARALTGKGMQQAALMAGWLKSRLPKDAKTFYGRQTVASSSVHLLNLAL